MRVPVRVAVVALMFEAEPVLTTGADAATIAMTSVAMLLTRLVSLELDTKAEFVTTDGAFDKTLTVMLIAG